MVHDAVLCHFVEEDRPKDIRPHLVKDELFIVWACKIYRGEDKWALPVAILPDEGESIEKLKKRKNFDT